MKKVLVVIGSRANFSSIRSALFAIDSHPKLTLILLCMASAVQDKYGNVIDEIEKDGFTVEYRVDNLVEGDKPSAMIKTTALAMQEIALILDLSEPDYVITIGDRYETMATAIASAYSNICLVHTMGGEVSGTLDEAVRHSITKLANIHFVANDDARQRVLKMGENPQHVYNVGCPRIDAIARCSEIEVDDMNKYLNQEGVGGKINIEDPFMIILFHPVTSELSLLSSQIDTLLNVSIDLDSQFIILFPNSDAGTLTISSRIRSFRELNPNVLSKYRFYKHLPHDIYINLLRRTQCLIGNSSSGIRDSAFLGAPVVNVGTRQNSRLTGDNVINSDFDAQSLKKSIEYQVSHGHYPPSHLYGDGKSGVQIANILASDTIVPTQKLIYY